MAQTVVLSLVRQQTDDTVLQRSYTYTHTHTSIHITVYSYIVMIQYTLHIHTERQTSSNSNYVGGCHHPTPPPPLSAGL